MMREKFFDLDDGRTAELFKLRLDDGFGADITSFGGAIVSIFAPDKNGKLRDVVLGWRDPRRYINNPGHLGALVGRVANRIGGGKFTLDGMVYQMCLNDRNASTLHGGFCYSKRLWNVERFNGTELVLSLFSPDGDAGFPGNLTVKATYRITPDHALELEFYAETDRSTIADFTNHAYFNLNGENSGPCNDHIMKINADFVTAVDEKLIPTGALTDVTGTRFDVRNGKRFSDIFAEHKGGFDDNFVLGREHNVWHEEAAVVTAEGSGIRLAMSTDRPGVQVYMAGGMKGEGKTCDYVSNCGFCLESQNWPDAANHPEFPSVRLDPGKPFKGLTRYQFSTVK